ncbi:hypothetical protein LAZ67_13000677 [Cordylochernes scorpioides]|uniref:DUF5641 domain-containing protein n=1 Tax=Cordylochernes scorpioides TaxID=51811 RepID=A0ABY6L356_9ARAC|nr:hypothetical protein LAZ67_13000677 [Cordylochernes scorpioides]
MEGDNEKRTEWPIGVIEKTYPGKDGIIRVAMIKTKCGNFLRPKEKKINLDTPSISQRSIRGKDSPVITRSGRIVKLPD